jgi:hypothetical protein
MQLGALSVDAAALAAVSQYFGAGRSCCDHFIAGKPNHSAGHVVGRKRLRANAVAGYGTGVRLENLLVLVVFGLGAPLVALVGTNIGAGQKERALRIQPRSAGDRHGHRLSAHRRTDYGLFGLGMALYFRLPGCGTTFLALADRMFTALPRHWRLACAPHDRSLDWLFAALALGLVVYGVTLAAAIKSGRWFSRRHSKPASP